MQVLALVTGKIELTFTEMGKPTGKKKKKQVY